MNIGKTGCLFIAVTVGGISPALADCCSSIFDCAATVVTDGLSCEIETLISTISTLSTVIKNLGNDVTGQTQSAQRVARQSVTDQFNSIQSASLQNATDLASAQTQADNIFRAETAPTATGSLAPGHAQSDVPAASQPPAPSPVGLASRAPSAPPLTELAASSTANGPRAPAGAPITELAAKSIDKSVVAPSGPPGIALKKSAVTAGTKIPDGAERLQAPHGQFGDAFARGLKRITELKGYGDSQMSQINEYLAKAQQSEGPGVAAANTLAGVIAAPITDMTSELSALLANPLQAYDPSARVESIEDDVKSHLNVNIQAMIDDITAGPNQQFTAAKPAYCALNANALEAKAIAAAMDRLYRQRTPDAAQALFGMLPSQQYAGLTSKPGTTGSLNGTNGQDLRAAAFFTSKISTAKQNAMLAFKLPDVDAIRTAAARFKVQRAQAESIRSPSMVQTYRSSLAQQLNREFAGKTPAAIAAQREQLIAQARVHFARDPRTGDGVIALISAEAQKQTASTPEIPGQPTPAVNASVTKPIAPAATAATAANKAAAATTRPTATAWGAAPGWSAPTAVVSPAAPSAANPVKPATAFGTVPTAQKPLLKPAVIQSAPTSLTTP